MAKSFLHLFNNIWSMCCVPGAGNATLSSTDALPELDSGRRVRQCRSEAWGALLAFADGSCSLPLEPDSGFCDSTLPGSSSPPNSDHATLTSVGGCSSSCPRGFVFSPRSLPWPPSQPASRFPFVLSFVSGVSSGHHGLLLPNLCLRPRFSSWSPDSF